jgi:hypothetical protein
VQFVRVVHRQGWDVELVKGADVDTRNFGSREDALLYARGLGPDWIELGEVVAAREGVPQHHRWTTLRRTSGGDYAASDLRWGGKEGSN